MPALSYPQVFPSRQLESPVERNNATPADVSAGQTWRSPFLETQDMTCGKDWFAGACCANALSGKNAAARINSMLIRKTERDVRTL
jgi:hypothetical protein